MTNEEVTAVAKIMMTADNECASCAGELFNLLCKAFPAHEDAIDAVWVAADRESKSWKESE